MPIHKRLDQFKSLSQYLYTCSIGSTSLSGLGVKSDRGLFVLVLLTVVNNVSLAVPVPFVHSVLLILTNPSPTPNSLLPGYATILPYPATHDPGQSPQVVSASHGRVHSLAPSLSSTQSSVLTSLADAALPISQSAVIVLQQVVLTKACRRR